MVAHCDDGLDFFCVSPQRPAHFGEGAMDLEELVDFRERKA
jgi:hypothetical protein